MLKQWGRVWAVGFVLWTLLAFLSAAGAHVYTASMGSPESWAQLLAWNLTISVVWSLLTPPIYALARRFTFERSNWKLVAAASFSRQHRHDLPRRVGDRHAGSAGHLDAGSAGAVHGAHAVSRAMDLQRYWYIVLITQAIAYYGKYRERELESSQLEAQLAHAQLEVLKISSSRTFCSTP